MKGLIAFANNGGLGAQTRRLANLLKPDRVMVIDSSNFSRNRSQHFEWYKNFNYFVVSGFPTNEDVQKFLPNLDTVLTVENPYNFGLVYWGKQQGTKIYCQTNYEFCDNLDKPWLPTPEFLMPSYWKMNEMIEKFGKDHVQYLPPPLDPDEFKKSRDINFSRISEPRFLHVIGTTATADRNGTLDLLEAVKKTKSDFELVIKTQHPLPMNYFLDDKRIKYEINDVKENSSLYENFDALIIPRRWGGLSLTINEALMSGLPVITTDISPNNEWLPEFSLVTSNLKGYFMARSQIGFYSADHDELANKIDNFSEMVNNRTILLLKHQSYELARKEFWTGIKERYFKLFK